MFALSSKIKKDIEKANAEARANMQLQGQGLG
jgi:hypothetical protein